MGVAKIDLPESRAGVAEPLRALMAKVEGEAHVDHTRPRTSRPYRRGGHIST